MQTGTVIQHDPGSKKSPNFPQTEHWLPMFLGLEHIAASHCRAGLVHAAFREEGPPANIWCPPKSTVMSIRIQLMLALCWPYLSPCYSSICLPSANLIRERGDHCRGQGCLWQKVLIPLDCRAPTLPWCSFFLASSVTYIKWAPLCALTAISVHACHSTSLEAGWAPSACDFHTAHCSEYLISSRC